MILLYFIFIIVLNFVPQTQSLKAAKLLRVYDFDRNQRRVVVQTHNFYRSLERAPNMNEMVWDPNLAALARDWVTRCIGWHRPGQERFDLAGYNHVGESIWWIAEDTLRDKLTEVIRDFWIEKRDYNLTSHSCTKGKVCGHYTQVVWAETCAIGCAASYCDNIISGNGVKRGHIILCNYGPGGNGLLKRPYGPGPQCQDCPNQCTKGLCHSQCRGEHFPMVTMLEEGPVIKKKTHIYQQRCIDKDGWLCGIRFQSGNCTRYPEQSKLRCPISCGLCDKLLTLDISPPSSPDYQRNQTPNLVGNIQSYPQNYKTIPKENHWLPPQNQNNQYSSGYNWNEFMKQQLLRPEPIQSFPLQSNDGHTWQSSNTRTNQRATRLDRPIKDRSLFSPTSQPIIPQRVHHEQQAYNEDLLNKALNAYLQKRVSVLRLPPSTPLLTRYNQNHHGNRRVWLFPDNA